jgi:hypothetical protein
MGVPTSEVDYTLATIGRGVHEVRIGHVVALEEKMFAGLYTQFQTLWLYGRNTAISRIPGLFSSDTPVLASIK